jgi:hypothetical protein
MRNAYLNIVPSHQHKTKKVVHALNDKMKNNYEIASFIFFNETINTFCLKELNIQINFEA